NSRGFKHRPNRSACNDTGPLRRGLEQHAPRAEIANHLVRNRPARKWNLEQVLLGLLRPLANRLGNFVRLAEPRTNEAVLVTYDHERGKAETPPTFDDLGHAIDEHHAIDELAYFFVLNRHTIPFLELQPRLAGGLGERADAPVINVAVAVEHHLRD